MKVVCLHHLFFHVYCGSDGAVFLCLKSVSLLRRGVLGDSLCAFGDGVLCKLTWQEETDCGLNLPTGDGRSLVVMCQARCFCGDALEDVVDEGVHDGHGLGRDSSVWVDLLQHLVDVDGIALLPPALLLLVPLGNCLLCLARLLGSLS